MAIGGLPGAMAVLPQSFGDARTLLSSMWDLRGHSNLEEECDKNGGDKEK